MIANMQIVIICLALVVMLTTLPLLSATQEDNEWIVDNVIPNMLRFNLKGQLISSDLSEYVKFKCTGEGAGRSCDIDQENMELSGPEDFTKPSSDGSVQSYGTGVALYAIISVAAGILVIVGTFLYLCTHIWCCAISRCTERKASTESKYSKNTRFGTAVVLTFSFFAFLTTVVLLCYAVGVKEAFGGMSDVADAPRGVAEITYRFSLATQPAFVDVVADVALPTLRNMNATLTEAVNWDAIIADLQSLNVSVHQLPDLMNVNASLYSIDAKLNALDRNFDDIKSYNSDYEASKVDIKNATDVLLKDLEDVDAALDSLETATEATHSSVVALQGSWADLYGAGGPENYNTSDQDGWVDAVQYDIARTVRNDTPKAGVPTSATLTDAATGATASMARLSSGALDGDVTELGQLIDKLDGIYSSIVQMPNFTVTANNLIKINDTVNSLLSPSGVVTVLPGQLDDIQTAIYAMPNTTVIKHHVQDVFDAIDSINEDTLTSLLEDSDAQISAILLDMDDILDELDKISLVIGQLRVPLQDLLVEQPKGFNRTIMELPYNFEKLFNTVNKSLTDAQKVASDATPELEDIRGELTGEVNITSYLIEITRAFDSLDEDISSFNQTAINAALDSATIDDSTFDAAAYTALIDSASSSLSDVGISLAVVDGFVALETLRFELERLLRNAVGVIGQVGSDGTEVASTGEYRLLVQGVCSGALGTYCSVDSDCGSGGGTCGNIAAYRCAADGSAVTTCAQDSDCTTTFCLADTGRANTLQASLLALAEPSVTDFGQDDVNTNTAAMRTACADVGLGGLETDLQDVLDDIIAANTSSYTAEILSIQDELNDPAMDFTSYMDELTEAQLTMDEVDIAQYADELEEPQEQIDKYGDKLEDYIRFLQDLRDYMFERRGGEDDGLAGRMSELEKDKLNAVLEAKGFGPVLMYVGGMFENTGDDFVNIMKRNSFNQSRVEITKELREPAMYMDRFTANPHAGFVDMYEAGSFYYMMQLTNETAKRSVNARDPKANLITTDSDGERYPEDRYCVTRKCFENQQEEFEEEYGALMPLIVVLPAIVALIALGNLACLFIPAKRGGCCRRCMPHWLLCMLIVIVPWYLIFSGLPFAFIMGTSDACTAGPRIAANYVTAYGDDLCATFGGNGTLTECLMSGNNFDVMLDLRRMTNVALGLEKCTGAADDPFGVPITAFSTQLRSSVETSTKKEVAKRKYRKYRAKPKAIVTDFTDGSAVVLNNFVNDIGADVITCENVQDVIEYFTSPVCYSVVGPLAWVFAMIYLAAWTMCCLGIPTAFALKNSFKWDEEELKREAEADGAGAGEGESLALVPASEGGEEGALSLEEVQPAGIDGAEVDLESGITGRGAEATGGDSSRDATFAAVPVAGATVAGGSTRSAPAGGGVDGDIDKSYLRSQPRPYYAAVATSDDVDADAGSMREGKQGEDTRPPSGPASASLPPIVTGTRRYQYNRAPSSNKEAEKMRADGLDEDEDEDEEL